VKIIGLCGGSGSGKGEVARMLREAGCLHLDADAIYHGFISGDSDCLRELADEFGKEIIAPNGALDRKKLAAIVFADGAEEKRQRLNTISHRYVLDEIRRRIADAKNEYTVAVVDAPLLFESGFNAECDAIISVIAPRDARIARIVERDGLTSEQAARRIDAQLDEEFLRSHSNFIIENKHDLSALALKVEKIIEIIKEI
jgi:dephospho-CoA kinase